MANGPRIEFSDGKRPPKELAAGGVTLIGSGALCAVRLEGAGVAASHARLTVDAQGLAWLEDVSGAGVLRNGHRTQGRERLGDGDRIDVGVAAMVFRGGGVARVANEAATMMAGELPESVKAVLAQKGAAPVAASTMMASPAETKAILEKAMAAKAAAPPAGATMMASPSETKAILEKAMAAQAGPTLGSAPAPGSTLIASPDETRRLIDAAIAARQGAHPAGIVVGAPEISPDNEGRTMQMEAPDFSALGLQLPPPEKGSTKLGIPPAPQFPRAPAPPPPAGPADPFRARGARGDTVGNGGPPPPVAAAPIAPTPRPFPAMVSDDLPLHAPVPPAPTPAWTPALAVEPPPVAPTWLPPAASAPPATAFMDAPAAHGGIAPPPAMGGYAATQQHKDPTPTAPSQQAYRPAQSVNVDRGFVASLTRAIGFIGQMLTLAKKNPILLRPLVYDAVITTPLMVVFAVLGYFFATSEIASYAILGVGTLLLYFVDYLCNGLTASLLHDQISTGRADIRAATPRVQKAASGILVFATVSAVFDLASTYARERNDRLARILIDILRKVWTTATYAIMPALVLEGLSFSRAFSRSKQLMGHDPTGVGAGIVAMSILSYAVAVVMGFVAWVTLHIPYAGGFLFFFVINLYWAVSGWLKISYATCFYMWARDCERQGSSDPALAPSPLRSVLGA